MGGTGSGRTGPRRRLVGFRLTDQAILWLDDRAKEEGLVRDDGQPNRSELMRRLFAYAAANMPKGWRPR
jgi:hypothetical protein